jgi:hypothetical protein
MSALAITVVTHDGRQDHRCRDGHFVCFGGCCWSILTIIQRLDGQCYAANNSGIEDHAGTSCAQVRFTNSAEHKRRQSQWREYSEAT